MNRKGKKMYTFLNNREILNIKVKRKDSRDRKITQINKFLLDVLAVIFG